MKIIKTYENYNLDELDLGRFSRKIIKNRLRPNKDGTFDYTGDLNFSNMNLNSFLELPVRFRNVNGYFFCSDNNLISLEGGPKKVGFNFDLNGNNLISLQYAPDRIGKNILAKNNPLLSKKYPRTTVLVYFVLTGNQINDFEFEITDEAIETIKRMSFDQRQKELEFFKWNDTKAYNMMLQILNENNLGYGEETKKMSDYVDNLTNAKNLF